MQTVGYLRFAAVGLLLYAGFLHYIQRLDHLTQNDPFVYGSLLAAILFLLIHQIVDWKNSRNALLWGSMFAIGFAGEILLFGLPTSIFPHAGFRTFASKGMLLEILNGISPFIFIALQGMAGLVFWAIYRKNEERKKWTK